MIYILNCAGACLIFFLPTPLLPFFWPSLFTKRFRSFLLIFGFYWCWLKWLFGFGLYLKLLGNFPISKKELRNKKVSVSICLSSLKKLKYIKTAIDVAVFDKN